MSPQLFHDGNNCGGKTTRAVLFLHNKPLLYYHGGGFLICFCWDFDTIVYNGIYATRKPVR
jgi:hypothetical protein